jgi:hypothetical protein
MDEGNRCCGQWDTEENDSHFWYVKSYLHLRILDFVKLFFASILLL